MHFKKREDNEKERSALLLFGFIFAALLSRNCLPYTSGINLFKNRLGFLCRIMQQKNPFILLLLLFITVPTTIDYILIYFSCNF